MDRDVLNNKINNIRCKLINTSNIIKSLPHKKEKFEEMINEYGAGYVAERIVFRTSGNIFKKRYISYEDFLRLNRPTAVQIKRQTERFEQAGEFAPQFVVYLITDGKTEEMINRSKVSLVKQTWRPRKLIIGSLKDMEVRLAAYVAKHPKRQLWVLRMEAGDTLSRQFFYRIARAIESDPAKDIWYTDHEERKNNSDDASQVLTYFKPDFSVDYLCSYYYIGPSYVTRAKAFTRKSENYAVSNEQFILDMAAEGVSVGHIHRMLYSRKQYDALECMWLDEKDEARIEAAIRKIYTEPGVEAVDIEAGPSDTRRVSVRWKEKPTVSVLIPTMNHVEDLYVCLKSLAKQSILDQLEIILIENNSDRAETFAFYKWLTEGELTVHLSEEYVDEKLRSAIAAKTRVVYWGGEFNYSAINNFGRKYASGDYLLLLNNDVELIGRDALLKLLQTNMRENVGAVGAKLMYEDGTIQHAGVVIGFGGVAGHAFVGRSRNDSCYMKQADCARRVSGVTAACMMVKASVYDALGGLDEGFAVAFNDVDFCMRICKLGKHIIYQPQCEAWHYESKSRGFDNTGKKMQRFQGEVARFMARYEYELLDGDDYYNHNLSLMRDDYSYRDPYWFDKDF